ncbi:MAG: hypothetical protein JWO53_584 [Chlamydiia bacterium]|nr:hypothetical protein [Chlamydiia bacterium]
MRIWIDEWLFKEKITIKGFADKLNISRQYLHAIISGKRRGSPDIAKKISELTNEEISITEILFGDREKRKKPPKER